MAGLNGGRNDFSDKRSRTGFDGGQRDLADISQVMAMLVIVVLGVGVDKLIFGRIEINIRERWGLDKA